MSRTRIVLLRGINVGGHRKVPMADLRAALVDAGLTNPRTYIQSGNVLIDDGPEDDADLSALVGRVLIERFGLNDVPVIVLAVQRLVHARQVSADHFPVGSDAAMHTKMVHVVLLDAMPAPVRRASLDPDAFGDDRFHLDIYAHGGVKVADLHVHYATGAGASKLTLDRIERAYGVRATARNLNTIDRLVALSDE